MSIESQRVRQIAVLITCHNRKDKTIACLKALHTCLLPTNTEFTVFLVDDGSTDKTADEVRLQYPKTQIIRGTGDLFWNRGMYLSWETAAKQHDYDYYLWLNDDTTLLPEALVEMLTCSWQFDGNVVVCGAIRSQYKEVFTYGGRTRDDKEVVPDGTIQSCVTINGNCVLVSRVIFKSVGMLDPVFPHAIGDYEYGMRVLKAGFNIVTTRAYIGYCERNPSLPKWCYSKYPLAERIRSLYSPLGNSHPYYYFLFERRHKGLSVAIMHFLSIHLRVLIPQLWK